MAKKTNAKAAIEETLKVTVDCTVYLAGYLKKIV